MVKYQIITFGCQFNQSDAERAAAILEKIGCQKALTETEADLIMVLACSVRQSAIDRVFGLKHKFEKIKKARPLLTVLSGCVLKSDLPKMKKIFDIVFDIKNLADLPRLLKTINYKQKTNNYLQIHPNYQSEFQAYVPIMTGCNNFCAYCVVPYVRGREISVKAKEVILECQNLISKGYKQISLAGQNVNSYKDGKIRFPQLLKMIDEIPGDYWLSFATSHPKDMSDKLIKVMAQAKHLISYLHLPVQSGDDEVLRKMNRRYTAKHYVNLVKKVRRAMPGITISTDIIVGFPGETKKQFANTVELFREVKFDMAYLAQYSPRAGTAAAKLKDDVPKEEKQRREKVINNVLKKTALIKNKNLVGKHLEVLVEKYKSGQCFGRTRNFKNIKFVSEKDLTGQIVLVKVTDCYAWGLSGELPKVVVVLGTTSAGKTKLAVKLAKKFNGEIVSADSRQVYRGMDIGTGKDLADYGKVPYHLIDVADPKSQFTVAQWQKQAYEAINNILKRGKLPIVCGGTGLYISALVEGYSLANVPCSKFHVPRNKLSKLTLKQLLNKLKRIDPVTYQVIDKKNRRRVQRALEIYYETGIPKSEQLKNQKPPYEFLPLGINFPKPVLHKRIDQRLKHRIKEEGMISEIKRLHRQGVSWQRLEDFGLEYRFVSRYLKKEISQEEMTAQLSRAIKDFAKRQMTWFRRYKNIIWLNGYKQAEGLIKKFIK